MFADCKAVKFGTDIRNVLFLFDMGYSSPALWASLDRRGAYFLTRLPTDRSPKVDVEAELRFHVRCRAGRPGRTALAHFRVVGVLNAETGEYHRYVTNIPVDWIPAEHIRDACMLRWEVETFYRFKAG